MFDALTDNLCQLLRLHTERPADPSVVILNSRTLQSTPESGHRAGHDGAKRRKSSKGHVAVETLGQLLVSPANAQDQAQVGTLAQQMQVVSGHQVSLAAADQGYMGDTPAQAAAEQTIDLQIVKLGRTRRGFVLRPSQWVGAQSELERPL